VTFHPSQSQGFVT